MAEQVKKTVKKAEPVKKTVNEAKKTVETASGPKQVKNAKPTGNATGLRVGAVISWIAAIACEVLAILVLFGKINLTFLPQIWQLIIFLVLDLIFVILGSQLWKKANHIDPASEKNKTKFWLWNNMGVIVAAFAFIPFIIIALTDKKADKKTKTIATIVAAAALLIGVATSIDYNPVSAEQKEAAVEVLSDTECYWAPFGKVYHLDMDCQALNNTETLTKGNVEEAIAANRVRLCAFCQKKHNVTGVVTDGE